MSENNGRFKPGNQVAKGNTVAPTVFEGRKMTRVVYEAILQKYMGYTLKQVQDSMAHPETPSIDLLVLSILSKAMKHGDPVRAEFLLSRLVGPTKDSKEPEKTDTSDEKIKGLIEAIACIAQSQKS